MKISDYILLAIALCSMLISLCALLFTWRMRKKDFQISIHKEQLLSAHKLVEKQLELQSVLINFYQQDVAYIITEKGLSFPDDRLWQVQNTVFLKAAPEYNSLLRSIQIQSILLPNSVLETGYDYLKYISDLFELHNDHELGIKLQSEVYNQINNTINAIRSELGIDHLSDANKTLFRSGGKSGS
jgi:hypothetical protein